MSVESAVIPVAGAGSRVFPVSTAVEKCMMPVYAGEQTRPVIDYVVSDCALAGINRVIFVTSERGQSQLTDYFEDINPALEEQLKALGKEDKLSEERARRQAFNLTFEYIIQPPYPYGTTVPISLAQDHLKGEPQFALLSGDDFVYRQDGGSELGDAIRLWDKAGSDHVIMGSPVPVDKAHRYGILRTDSRGNLTEIDEKPPQERVPDNPVANISRYLLSDAMWPHIEQEMSQDRGQDEHVVINPINSALASGQSFHVHAISGKYLDGGSFEGLHQAGLYVTANPKTSN